MQNNQLSPSYFVGIASGAAGGALAMAFLTQNQELGVLLTGISHYIFDNPLDVGFRWETILLTGAAIGAVAGLARTAFERVIGESGVNWWLYGPGREPPEGARDSNKLVVDMLSGAFVGGGLVQLRCMLTQYFANNLTSHTALSCYSASILLPVGLLAPIGFAGAMASRIANERLVRN